MDFCPPYIGSLIFTTPTLTLRPWACSYRDRGPQLYIYFIVLRSSTWAPWHAASLHGLPVIQPVHRDFLDLQLVYIDFRAFSSFIETPWPLAYQYGLPGPQLDHMGSLASAWRILKEFSEIMDLKFVSLSELSNKNVANWPYFSYSCPTSLCISQF